MPYIYQADTYCYDCGKAIIADLDIKGQNPEAQLGSRHDESTFDSDDFPKHASEDEEVDSPAHCGHCGEPLGNPLTIEGVRYVLAEIKDSIQEAVDQGRATTWDRIMPPKGTGEETMTHWHGSRHVEILRGWAESIRDYSLDAEDSALVALFLELSEKP